MCAFCAGLPGCMCTNSICRSTHHARKMPTRPLRPVVAANCSRLPALGHDPVQYSRHSPTGKTDVHFQSQTPPRVRIHHAQHPYRSLQLPQIHNGFYSKLKKSFFSDCADARKAPNRQRQEKRIYFLGPENEETIRFAPVGVKFCQKFIRRHTC
jgi:hypothetical protein